MNPDCPKNVELERPRNYVEMISGSESWSRHGIRILNTVPKTPGESNVKVGAPIPLRMEVQVRRDPQKAPQCIFAYCWTHIRTQDNPCSLWKEIFLHFNPNMSSRVGDDEEIKKFVYEGSLVPDFCDRYRITFLIKWNHVLIWNNAFKKDCFVDVS
ncbi:hypothetical protein PoB_003669800 [Plakobranchus ocellatus]|uniref:Uncharacterized protein n=1 Tax=Plakobranchus ocellatus TaxID=259542 RepID=A0AAV4AS48_9GAST|nr:hypothetical protein PoB_003669800 [Plakobranchus ocellatus]